MPVVRLVSSSEKEKLKNKKGSLANLKSELGKANMDVKKALKAILAHLEGSA